jgi:hypothetical protein
MARGIGIACSGIELEKFKWINLLKGDFFKKNIETIIFN